MATVGIEKIIRGARSPRAVRVLAWGLALGACSLLIACSGEEGKKEPVVTVQVASATRTTLQEVVHADAILYPIDQAAITPKISAPVSEFKVQRGAKVKAGQLLAVLENKDLSAAAMDNKGSFEQAQASYETALKSGLPEEWQKAEADEAETRQALDAAQKVYEARQQLFKEGALPRRDLDQGQLAYLQAKNQHELSLKHLQALQAGIKQQELKGAEGQLQSAQGKYQGAEAQLSYSEIRSPINGVVTDRPLYPGEMAAAGTPLITVMDLSKVVARAHIPQEQAALLKVGDSATISNPGSDEKVPGKVTVVSPALDPNSTTVEIWVQAANPKNELRPGSTVQVDITAAKVPDAIAVPESALLKGDDGKTQVMVVGSDNRAHQTDVKVGVVDNGQVQIAEGLKPGDKVISVGAFGLADKTQVQVASAASGDKEGADSGKSSAGKDKDEDKD